MTYGGSCPAYLQYWNFLSATAEYSVLSDVSKHRKVDKAGKHPWYIYIGVAGMPGELYTLFESWRLYDVLILISEGKRLTMATWNTFTTTLKRCLSRLTYTAFDLNNDYRASRIVCLVI